MQSSGTSSFTCSGTQLLFLIRAQFFNPVKLVVVSEDAAHHSASESNDLAFNPSLRTASHFRAAKPWSHAVFIVRSRILVGGRLYSRGRNSDPAQKSKAIICWMMA
jgi:hypothetical protein